VITLYNIFKRIQNRLPEIDWKQPPPTTYKKEPKSYLPEDCKE
tara:strand:+ start:1003 stop:1131 length:129 start_codon:yes stop_codon:yes gene_type:complete